MTKLLPKGLSRRERQIMQILYARGQATVAEVLAEYRETFHHDG